MYTSLGLTAVVYVLHGILLHGWHVQCLRMSLMWALFTAFLFVLGAGLYALRVCKPQPYTFKLTRFQLPEKWYPLRFDIYGASHQIFHFMVLFGGLAHTVGLVQACMHVHCQR